MNSHSSIRLLLAFVCQLVASDGMQAQILAQSTFDQSADGWTVVDFSSICGQLPAAGSAIASTWTATGGAPGGYLRYAETNTGRTAFFRAPAAYRGNLAAAYGGTLTFEQRFTTTDADIYYALDDVYLQGGGVTLIADAPNPSRDCWGHTKVPLLPGYWRVNACTGVLATEAQIRSVLAGVTELYIRAEHANTAVNKQTCDLDTVILDATPFSQSCQATWKELDANEPTGRWRHTIAVDTDHNVLVLFGGDTGEAETWEYALTSGVWTRYQPSPSPTRRGGHAMVYDAARKKVVMSGGGYIVSTAEVWEYDAGTHSWAVTTALPQARSGHSMAYDSARKTIVLYGGLGSGVAGSVDVLERSSASASWSVRASDSNPGPQVGYAMTYDVVRQRTVLVGDGTTAISVAEWDGVTGTWDFRSFTGSLPAARANPVLVYDTQRSRVVLVGGEASRTTWDYDGSVWTQRADLPVSSRDEHAGAYDPVHHRVLIYSGIRGSSVAWRDLLAFDGSTSGGTWSTMWSRGFSGACDLFGINYDEAGHRAIMFGGGLLTRPPIVQQFGATVLAFASDTWTAPTVTGAPGTRWFHQLVYNPDRNSMMMYGGATGSGASTASSHIWELNLQTMAWTDRSNLTPGQRFDHAAAYDRQRRRMVIFGGINEVNVALGDTQLYDPQANTWTSLDPGAPSPGLRAGASMAYDQRRGVTVLFGGSTGNGTLTNTTWEWDGTQWHDVTPVNGNPPARLRPRLVYDTRRQTVVMFSGVTNHNTSLSTLYAGRAYTDVWEWNGASWSPILVDPTVLPTALVYGNATYDTDNGRVLHFGGSSITNGTYRNGQMWALTLPDRLCDAPCAADFNLDGFVDVFDFTDFITCFEGGTCPAGQTPDFNRDGFADIYDFSDFVTAFEAGC